MVPGAGIEPARCCHRGILSPLRLPISPSGHNAAMRLTFGGWGRNRTGVNGVAVRCMTTLPPSHSVNQRRLNYSNIRNILHVFIASSLVVIPFSTKKPFGKKSLKKFITKCATDPADEAVFSLGNTSSKLQTAIQAN